MPGPYRNIADNQTVGDAGFRLVDRRIADGQTVGATGFRRHFRDRLGRGIGVRERHAPNLLKFLE
jgi:hypothetical protein